MNKHRILLIIHTVIPALVISASAMLSGCTQAQQHTEQSTEAENTIIETVSEKTDAETETKKETQNMTNDKIICDDILSVADLIGKTYEECGLQKEPEDFDVKMEGTFFGTQVKGTAWFFSPSNESNIPCMEQARFTVKGSSINDFYTQLMDCYSGPSDSGM